MASHVGIELKGEKGDFVWEEKGIMIEGYDLESEKIMLALGGNKAEGMGVLLIVLNELEITKNALQGELEAFGQDIRDINENSHTTPRFNSSLTHLYLAYSPILNFRKKATSHVPLSIPGWECFLKETEIGVLSLLAQNQRIPSEYMNFFLYHENEEIRFNLAYNNFLPKNIVEILDNDRSPKVRYVITRYIRESGVAYVPRQKKR